MVAGRRVVLDGDGQGAVGLHARLGPVHVRELVEGPLHDLDAVAPAEVLDQRGAASDGDLLGALGGDGAGEVELHQAGPGPGRGVHDGRAGLADRSGERVDGPFHQPVGDVDGVGVPGQHGVDDLVDRAGAAGVVGGVEHDLAPGPVEERPGPPAGREEQRGERLGHALERALRRRPRPASRRPGWRPRP